MPPAQYAEFRKTWIERTKREEKDLLALRALLMGKVNVCANEIKKLGAKQVILFGSLAVGRFRFSGSLWNAF